MRQNASFLSTFNQIGWNFTQAFFMIIRYWICKMVAIECITKFKHGWLGINFTWFIRFSTKNYFRPQFISHPLIQIILKFHICNKLYIVCHLVKTEFLEKVWFWLYVRDQTPIFVFAPFLVFFTLCQLLKFRLNVLYLWLF